MRQTFKIRTHILPLYHKNCQYRHKISAELNCAPRIYNCNLTSFGLSLSYYFYNFFPIQLLFVVCFY